MQDRPEWLTLTAPSAETLNKMQRLLTAGRLHTVCQGADCPNVGECFAHHTCTFMVMGDVCTRNCRFCAVSHGRPLPLDPGEPEALAMTARHLGLEHVVVTSVTRDDLPDGGAAHFAAVVEAIRACLPQATVELLVPDFAGKWESLDRVIAARPEVIAHNIETVPRLYPEVRPGASYQRSLRLLARVKETSPDTVTKSGMMLGLGETETEVASVMEDLLRSGCQVLTLGQYLQPTSDHLPVAEYVHPETFERWAERGEAMGFAEVVAGPLVRSSYHAAASMKTISGKGGKKHGQGRQV